MRGSLRSEPRHRTVELVGAEDPANVELDPAAVEVEEWRAREIAIGARTEFGTAAIDPEVVGVLEPFGMRQQHDANSERVEAELVDDVDLACPANRAAAMAETELRRNDQDVRVTLDFRKVGEELLRTSRQTQVLRTELTFAEVVELTVAGLLEDVEHLLHGAAVDEAEDLRVLDPVGDREPAFGTLRERDFAFLDLREQILIGVADAGEELAQTIALLGQALGLVAGQIAVGRRPLFVLVFVGDRQILEGGHRRLQGFGRHIRRRVR